MRCGAWRRRIPRRRSSRRTSARCSCQLDFPLGAICEYSCLLASFHFISFHVASLSSLLLLGVIVYMLDQFFVLQCIVVAKCIPPAL